MKEMFTKALIFILKPILKILLKKRIEERRKKEGATQLGAFVKGYVDKYYRHDRPKIMSLDDYPETW